MTQYVGILDGNGKTYGVRIPDLPGCYGAGRSPEAALTDAMSAAREWLAHRATKGETLPKPRTMAQILKAEEIDPAANEIAVLVPVVLDKGRIVEIGTHRELMRSSDIYREIVSSQLSEEESA